MSMVDIGRFIQDGVGAKNLGIKSIQQVTASGAITEVVEANSIIIGWPDSGATVLSYSITSATSVSLSGHTTAYVIEFLPGYIKSKQTGFTQNTANTTESITLSPIDITKSIAILQNIAIDDPTFIAGRPLLVNSTRLDIIGGGSSSDIYSQNWTVVEFDF